MLREKTNFLSHGRKWVRLWFGIYENIKIKKTIKRKQNKKKKKLLDMIVSNFLYTNSKLSLVTRNTRTQSSTFFQELFLALSIQNNL